MASVGSVNAVTQGTLVRIVAGVQGLPEDRLPAIRARLRNFLSLGFPDVSGAGPGVRTEYWPEHVADTLVAFELCRFRMPQTAAAKAVTTSRDAVREAIGNAGRRLETGADRDGVLLWVRSNAFLEDAKRADLADVNLSGEPAAVSASSWTIDCLSLLESTLAAARSTDEPLDASFFSRLNRDHRG